LARETHIKKNRVERIPGGRKCKWSLKTVKEIDCESKKFIKKNEWVSELRITGAQRVIGQKTWRLLKNQLQFKTIYN